MRWNNLRHCGKIEYVLTVMVAGDELIPQHFLKPALLARVFKLFWRNQSAKRN
jgi:hypothetical protein